MVDNVTANRNYPLPHEDNDLDYDVLRLVAALTAIDVDIAGLLVSLAAKAAAVHTHTITDTTGLQGALDAKIASALIGAINGVASLDETGKIPSAQLPAALFGALAYQGTWNANTNTPTIPAAASGNKGFYYKVGTAGSTTVDGNNDWKIGDWIVSNGTVWDKVDNTDQVVSVAGLQGAITASALKTALSIPASIPLYAGDLNSIVETGTVYIAAAATNHPDSPNYYFVDTYHIDGNTALQHARQFFSAEKAYRRVKSGAVWGAWSRIRETEADLDARYLLLANLATAAQIRAGTASKVIASDGNISALGFNQLTYAASMTIDHNDGINRWVTLAGNGAFAAPTNVKHGVPLNLIVGQDATGGRVPTWNSNFDFGDAGIPTLSSGANQQDLLTFLATSAGVQKFSFLGIRKRVD